MDYKKFDNIGNASQDTKTRILTALKQKPMKYKQLSKKLKMAKGTVYYNAKKLINAGKIQEKKAGRFSYLGLVPKLR